MGGRRKYEIAVDIANKKRNTRLVAEVGYVPRFSFLPLPYGVGLCGPAARSNFRIAVSRQP